MIYVRVKHTANRDDGKVTISYINLIDSAETARLVASIHNEEAGRYTGHTYEELPCDTVEEARDYIASKGFKLNPYVNEILTATDFQVISTCVFSNKGLRCNSHRSTTVGIVESEFGNLSILVRNNHTLVVRVRLDRYMRISLPELLAPLNDYYTYVNMNLSVEELTNILTEMCAKLALQLDEKLERVV